ncbi:MAG: M48 family peptidase [Bacteroidetes bacterium]|nr:MAG: M48 family peptidase [Bacteroidota bacterium]
MQYYLEIANERIPIEQQLSPGRRLRISFPSDQPILQVAAPPSCSQEEVEAFLRKKSRWIVKHYLRLREGKAKREAFLEQIRQGKVLYAGRLYELVFEKARQSSVRVQEKQIHIKLPAEVGTFDPLPVVGQVLRALAKQYLTHRTRVLARHTSSQVNHIRIKAQRSKWGSCSNKANINLNWHLIFLPPTLVDYLIIHELMHLREMNHSPRFWQWVAHFYPDYQHARKAIHQWEWLIGVMEEG